MNTATIQGARADQRRVSGDHHHEHARSGGVMTCPNTRARSTLSKIAGVLHFLEDDEDPWGIVNVFKDQMAPGSFLVISHVTADHLPPDAARRARAVYAGASAPGVARSREQIGRFFAGLEMVSPGLADVSGWRPGHLGPPPGPAVFYAGIGRKSAPGRPR
jgi:S-adenosyl methyltransferase